MRYKSAERMEEIRQFIDDYCFEHRRSPSIQTIAGGIGVVKSTVYKYLLEMNNRGMIEYDGKSIKTAITQKADFSSKMTPILGSIVCGEPEYAEENFEEYVSLPSALFGSGDFFILRTYGDSMIEAGIEDGDMVVVRRQNTACEGDIVVALVENETTLKTFRWDNAGRVVLHPENKSMNDIYPKTCYIQGVAEHIIKTVRRR